MKVLVAVDKSEESITALQSACLLLEQFDAKVDAVYVKPNESDTGAETLYAPFADHEQIKDWIEKEAEGVKNACEIGENGNIPSWPQVLSGDPADEILNKAQTQQYDLIVLGAQSHSFLKGFVLGTVHAKILHHAHQPVMIVRNYRPIQRILIAYRGSECDQDALDFIGLLLKKKRPTLTVLHVQEAARGENESVGRNCLMKAEQKLKEMDHIPEIKMVKGDFTDEILKEVATGRYDLVVLGAYGYNRPKYYGLISDEALNIARLTTRPVLVFRNAENETNKPVNASREWYGYHSRR